MTNPFPDPKHYKNFEILINVLSNVDLWNGYYEFVTNLAEIKEPRTQFNALDIVRNSFFGFLFESYVLGYSSREYHGTYELYRQDVHGEEILIHNHTDLTDAISYDFGPEFFHHIVSLKTFNGAYHEFLTDAGMTPKRAQQLVIKHLTDVFGVVDKIDLSLDKADPVHAPLDKKYPYEKFNIPNCRDYRKDNFDEAVKRLTDAINQRMESRKGHLYPSGTGTSISIFGLPSTHYTEVLDYVVNLYRSAGYDDASFDHNGGTFTMTVYEDTGNG